MVLLQAVLWSSKAIGCYYIHGGITMELEKIKQKNRDRRYRYHWQRWLAVCLVTTLVISNLNFGTIYSYATENRTKTFEIGEGVTARLEEGVLTITGNGDIYDYEEETAPFLEYQEEIQSLVIEDGITYIGAYTFYGLGKLAGELTLPGSIIGFGDYAFSGSSKDHAPAFTRIYNAFEDGEAVGRGKGDQLAATPSQVDATPSEATLSEATLSQASAKDISRGYRVDHVTEQVIGDSGILFYPGQSGWFTCTEENLSFIETTESAGYRRADGVAAAVIDEMVELELPLFQGKVCLPECPEEIVNPYEDEPLFTGEFAGWRSSIGEDISPVVGSGEYMEIREDEPLKLYSVWKAVGKYHLKVETRREGDMASYTLTAEGGEEPLESVGGYALFYQWQTASREAESQAGAVDVFTGGIHAATPSELHLGVASAASDDLEGKTGDDGWTDIEGATDAVYRRQVEDGDRERQFRCVVTAEKLMRSSGGTIKLYSDAAVPVAESKTVYVNQKATGSTLDGSEANPFTTIEQAAEALTTKSNGGTVETNHIILLDDYLHDVTGWNFLQGKDTPVTIGGKSGSSVILGMKEDKENNANGFYLYSDIAFENVTLSYLGHIYGNGHDIRVGKKSGKDVEMSPKIYLYGSGQNDMTTIVGKIEIYSGSCTRIVGYVRSNPDLNANNKEANITVGGSAHVDTIIAGCASGPANNANVKINIIGGSVDDLVGGNQGYLDGGAAFAGKTEINISGGTVGRVLGAGSGREASIPTYSGTMDINVTGGNVGDIYGSGTAAYVISGEAAPSVVSIIAKGGTIGNIYAAGVGGDNRVGLYKDKGVQLDSESGKFCGSLTGNANITIDGATVNGNVYASGQGYGGSGNKDSVPYGQKSAFLKGDVTIKLVSGQVNSIYGGGKGLTNSDYETCARVEEGSHVSIEVTGGKVNGSVYGGGENALVNSSSSVIITGGEIAKDVFGGGKSGLVKGSTSVILGEGTVHGVIYGGGENAEVSGSSTVTISGGTAEKNIYGGGKSGLVKGKTTVNISNGTVNNSVYGGALGTAGERYVYGGSTINMTGGWVRGNLYGGSELSDDGPESSGGQDASLPDLIFVNLVGGTVKGNVFGGGFQGVTNGSTHVHIGQGAIDKCTYYSQMEPKADKPELKPGNISIGGSVYAGGDYGGDGKNYDRITVNGFSNVYLDGTGYSIGGDGTGQNSISIAGGVFGSGASCDAGEYRVVTLDNWGSRNEDKVTVTGSLTSIQRADQVLLINSHVELAGQSDAANANQTANYSLNRIGDQGKKDQLGALGNSLVLKDGSTLVLDSASIEMANFKSVDHNDQAVTLNSLASISNTIILTTGTVFRVSSTEHDNTRTEQEVYGEVSGYTYMIAGDTAEAYAYARVKDDNNNTGDGGFVGQGETKELDYTNVGTNYRYWQLAGAHAGVERDTVLTAEKLDPAPNDGYSVAKGVLDLPPAGTGSSYMIQKITIPTNITLVEAAKDGDNWILTDNSLPLSGEQKKMSDSPLSAFGLYMRPGKGFKETKPKVVSAGTAGSGSQTIIGARTEEITDTAAGTTPEIEFYLTYYNDGITASKDVGTVEIVLQKMDGEVAKETITMKVAIVTKATVLSAQTVELYATQTGSYTGRLVIPSGMSRTLTLAGVQSEFPGEGASQTQLVGSTAANLSGYQIAVTMEPVKGQGWKSADLMESAYDLNTFKDSSAVSIGSTDSRYEASMDFVLYNAKGFSGKTSDKIILNIKDENDNIVPITLEIHWKDSIVSKIQVGAGKQYNRIDIQPGGEISKNSAITAAFTVNSTGDQAGQIWLELQKDNGTRVALPEQTKLTLLRGNEFYFYQVDGTEADNKIPLTSFKKMHDSAALNGNVNNETLTVVIDFEASGSAGVQAAGLEPGDYSLRLRNDSGADSMGAAFTVNGSTATVALGTGVDIGNNQYRLDLTLTRHSDTRLTDGAALVLSPKGGSSLPDGVIFRYGTKEYVPIGGKVYLVLTDEREIIMDYKDVPNPEEGIKELTAQVFSVGASSGNEVISTVDTTYSVTAKPSYGLKVSLSNSAERLVKPGDNLKFTINYSVDREGESITVAVKKKVNGGYVDYGDWKVTKMDISKGTGAREKSITVPANTGPGTYRLIFKLGDKEVPYNVIVQSSDGS